MIRVLRSQLVDLPRTPRPLHSDEVNAEPDIMDADRLMPANIAWRPNSGVLVARRNEQASG